MKGYKPEIIIVVMLAIEDEVRRAAKMADLESTPLYSVPFPAQGNQRRYVAALSGILQELKRDGRI